jgi:hypothetical protein
MSYGSCDSRGYLTTVLLEDFGVSVSMPTPLFLTVQGLSILLLIQ